MNKVTISITYPGKHATHTMTRTAPVLHGWVWASVYRLLILLAGYAIQNHANNFIGHNRIARIENKWLAPLRDLLGDMPEDENPSHYLNG